MATTVIRAAAGLDSAFEEVARRIFALCKGKESNAPLVIGLCGGRSVVGLLAALERESSHQPKEILKRLQFFMVDERLVPISHEQSNFGGLKRLLFDNLIAQNVISEEQLHPFRMSSSDADFGCGHYQHEFAKAGGRFTAVVLGVGEDGHVAGLFPHHPALLEGARTFVHFHDSPKPPAGRMTATAALIEDADISILLALGEGKRAALDAFKNGAIHVDACPAKLAERAKECLLVTDLE